LNSFNSFVIFLRQDKETLENEETAGEIIKTVSGGNQKKKSISDLAFSTR
jgi:hypothetical protein